MAERSLQIVNMQWSLFLEGWCVLAAALECCAPSLLKYLLQVELKGSHEQRDKLALSTAEVFTWRECAESDCKFGSSLIICITQPENMAFGSHTSYLGVSSFQNCTSSNGICSYNTDTLCCTLHIPLNKDFVQNLTSSYLSFTISLCVGCIIQHSCFHARNAEEFHPICSFITSSY